MIIAVGVDLVEVARIERLRQKQGQAFLDRVFTADELEYCCRHRSPAQSLAARFAAKEAVMKCLGTGWAEGVGFDQIEVQRSPSGAVSIAMRGQAAAVAAELGIDRVFLSLSHTDGHAIAYAIAERA